MSLQLPKTIADTSSNYLLTTHVIENRQVIQSPIAQAKFLLKQLHRPNVRYFPLKQKDLPQEICDARHFILKNDILRARGERVTYFAYNRETCECVGTITATVLENNTVEITQSVERTDYLARYEMMRLMQKSLLERSGAPKIITRILADSIDNIRWRDLLLSGFKYHSESHNRLMGRGEIDYITFVQENPNLVEAKAPKTAECVCSSDRKLPVENSHVQQHTA